ncbi:hypothetical protein KSP39_PZI011000 [Platanthera zijinensis]|uniref:Uncharacterized protein n=1 Tax=Platanthera zijinensis TaxID=2320716 RepID=A0AAP0BHH2_9ASPA
MDCLPRWSVHWRVVGGRNFPLMRETPAKRAAQGIPRSVIILLSIKFAWFFRYLLVMTCTSAHAFWCGLWHGFIRTEAHEPKEWIIPGENYNSTGDHMPFTKALQIFIVQIFKVIADSVA